MPAHRFPIAALNGALALWSGLSGGLRDSVFYGASLGWTKALAMLTLPLLTAMLAPADFARLELLSSAGEIGALFAGAGLVDTAYRFASGTDAKGKRAAGEILGLATLIALAGIGLTVAFAAPLAAMMPLPTKAAEIVLLGSAVALEALIAVPLAFMRMRGKAGTYAAATAIRSTVQAGLVAGCVAAGWGATGVLAGGMVAAVAAAGVLAARQARDSGLIVAPQRSGHLLAYGVPLVGGGLASFVLGTADRWLLAGTVDAANIGQYALAAKIAMVAALLTQPFELWWYPRRVGLLTQTGGIAQSARIVTAGITLTVLAAAGAAVAGPILIHALTPPAYHAAAAMVPWLCAAIALQSLGSLVNVGCYAGKTGAMPMLINMAAAAVALACYALLIPAYGVDGAIAATVAAQGARFGLFLIVSQRRVHVPLSLRPLLLPIGCAMAAAALPQVPGLGLLGYAGGVALMLAGVVLAMISGAVPSPVAFRARPAAALAGAGAGA
jgi:O-antigen/teichoic acid export membrane protein